MTTVKQSGELRRVRVAVRVQTDWERIGCRHFLTRQAYEATKSRARQRPVNRVRDWLAWLLGG